MKTMPNKKKGAVVTGVIAVLAMAGVTAAFVTSASPYVTIKEAQHISGDSLHLAGAVDLPSLRDDRVHNKLQFVLADKNGDRIPVIYTGEPLGDLRDAKQVVAIGHVVNGVFVSEKMLVKCPTKYKSTDSKSGA
jgi:cytochrome c-type biogenesis protein CcmE